MVPVGTADLHGNISHGLYGNIVLHGCFCTGVVNLHNGGDWQVASLSYQPDQGEQDQVKDVLRDVLKEVG